MLFFDFRDFNDSNDTKSFFIFAEKYPREVSNAGKNSEAEASEVQPSGCVFLYESDSKDNGDTAEIDKGVLCYLFAHFAECNKAIHCIFGDFYRLYANHCENHTACADCGCAQAP